MEYVAGKPLLIALKEEAPFRHNDNAKRYILLRIFRKTVLNMQALHLTFYVRFGRNVGEDGVGGWAVPWGPACGKLFACPTLHFCIPS